jgi:hypothetical protein
MCDFIAIAGLALNIASGVMQYQAQDAAFQQQEQMYEENRQMAMANFRHQNDATTMRQAQEQETAANEKFDTMLEARSARATARVAAGESGVSGFSTEHLLRDMYSRESRFNGRVDTNLDWTMNQLQMEKKSQGFKALDRINSVQRGTPPNFADAALRIGTGAINSMSSYQQRTGKSAMNFAA